MRLSSGAAGTIVSMIDSGEPIPKFDIELLLTCFSPSRYTRSSLDAVADQDKWAIDRLAP
jgi:hypothetical protein